MSDIIESIQDSAQKTKQLIENAGTIQRQLAMSAAPSLGTDQTETHTQMPGVELTPTITAAQEQTIESTDSNLDDSKYAGLLDPYDLSDNPSDEDIAAKWGNLSPEEQKAFNRANGYKGVNPWRMRRDIVDSYVSGVRERRKEEEAASRQAAIDAANADIKIPYGDGQSYTVTKDFSDWYKTWEAAYSTAKDQASRTELVEQLSSKMQENGLPAMDVVDAGVDAQGNPIDPFESYVSQFLDGGKGDLTQFQNFQKVLDAAEKDRTPKEPEKKSWEEMWYDRQAKQYALDRDKEQRRIQGERLGRGIGDLAATIGDMVRASEGAPVTQRDWQKYYDALTAQEKANVNNYQIRMAKLNEDIRADRARKDAMAFAAAQKAADNQFKLTLEAAKQQGALKKQAASDEEAMKRAEVAAKARTDGAKKGGADIVIGDKRFHFKTAYDLEAFINAFDGIIRDKANYPAGATVPTVNIQDNWDTQRRKQELQNFVIGYFTSEAWKNAPKAVKDKIAKEIKKNAYRLVTDETPAITINGAEQTSSAGSATPVVLTPQDSAQISTNLLNLFQHK